MLIDPRVPTGVPQVTGKVSGAGAIDGLQDAAIMSPRNVARDDHDDDGENLFRLTKVGGCTIHDVGPDLADLAPLCLPTYHHATTHYCYTCMHPFGRGWSTSTRLLLPAARAHVFSFPNNHSTTPLVEWIDGGSGAMTNAHQHIGIHLQLPSHPLARAHAHRLTWRRSTSRSLGASTCSRPRP